MNGYIYCIENKINHKMYIGKTTKKLLRRYSDHLSSARKGSNYIIHKAIRKYGSDNFDLFILEEIFNKDKLEFNKELSYCEKFYIEILNTFNNGYNMTKGGDGVFGYRLIGENNPAFGKFGKDHPAFGYHHTIEAKRKISIGASKNHIDVSGKNNPMYGVKGKNAPSAKTVINLTTKEIFYTINDAAQKHGISYACISRSCNSKNSKAGGFKWEFI